MTTPTNARECPNCGNKKSKVTETRLIADFLRRTRLCPKCRYQWHTKEYILKEIADGTDKQ